MSANANQSTRVDDDLPVMMMSKHRHSDRSNSSKISDDERQGPSGSELLQAIVSEKGSRTAKSTPKRKNPGSKAEFANHDHGDEEKVHGFEGGRDRHSPTTYTARMGNLPKVKRVNVAKATLPPPPPRPPPPRYAGSEHGTAVSSLMKQPPLPSSKCQSNQSAPPRPSSATSAPSPVAITGNDDDEENDLNFKKQFAHLSNYRHLSKSERRRLLKEVKQVLGEDETLLSGYTNGNGPGGRGDYDQSVLS